MKRFAHALSFRKLKKAIAAATVMSICFANIFNAAVYAEGEYAGSNDWWNERNNIELEYTYDENGEYPTYHDEDVNLAEDKVVNPNTGITSPSIETETQGLSDDDPEAKLRRNRTVKYEEGWVTKYASETENQGETEINLRVEAKEEQKKTN